MKAFILSGLLLSVLFTSCKDDKAVDTNETAKAESKTFTVTFNAVVEKDDTFQVFYNEDGGDNFAPEDAVTINIKGSTQPQDLVFELPKEAMPMSLRFDIGANKELKQVPFKSFKIEYLDKKIEGTTADFFKYFYPNTQVEIDTVNTTAKIKLLEGEPYDPILGSTVDLKKQIETLYAKKVE
ncbi:hypothetical protein [Flavobacterium proteolyticum]|uniref:Lipoprotein n=1 Tax=Flavobacterium proteolyticum TaxID=2911683 RepID=A0ABR9WPA4_9FLAO|nr:hypothetical protein [Flavobacterium proteolyticum]MBE9575755.1 hypothetical protein [Flavobacterium proteolyticum]